MNAMLDFIWMVSVELWDTWGKQKLLNEKFLSAVGFELATLRLLGQRLIHITNSNVLRIIFHSQFYTCTKKYIYK